MSPLCDEELSLSHQPGTRIRMSLSLPVSESYAAYPVVEKALRRWASERVQRATRDDGGTEYTFHLSGSTCTNVALDVLMTVSVDASGRIESAVCNPAPGDKGC